MKKKLLFVIDNLEFGGGERVFAQIINGLPSERYEIFLASGPGEELHLSLSQKDVFCIPLDFSKRVNPSLSVRLARIIKDKKIDLVHGQGGRAEFYARIATKLAGSVKYVSTIAMPVEGYDVRPLRKKTYRLFDSTTEKYVDTFIVVSDVLKNTLIHQHRIPPEKVKRIYNGIEINLYDPAISESQRTKTRNYFGVRKEDVLIGALGRLVWQKGFEHLLHAARELLKLNKNIKILLVGDGPLKEKLKSQASDLEIDNCITFTGFRSNITEILSAIDILVIPSLLEGFPMVTLEGMAMAKPIVATRIDGITEQISDGVEGILVPPKDPDSLAKAIMKIIEDKNLTRTLGVNARRKVEKEFSVKKMISETEKVYQSLLT